MFRSTLLSFIPFISFVAGLVKTPISIHEGQVNSSKLHERQDDTRTVATCHLNYTTNVWTGCADVLKLFNITLDSFRTVNPKIGDRCANFVPGETYCVRGASTSIHSIKISTDGLCGAQQNWTSTCVGSQFGDCCGAGGFCGIGQDYCGKGNCQEGSCDGGQPYSTDGLCGSEFDYVPCPPKFGECCSAFGFCGSTSKFCGTGCQSGPCQDSPTASSASSSAVKSATVSATPSPSPFSISTDGTCAYRKKLVCKGSTFGDCCSAAGYCGSTQYHCFDLLGCKPEFGSCNKA